jgi:hypothetical protein
MPGLVGIGTPCILTYDVAKRFGAGSYIADNITLSRKMFLWLECSLQLPILITKFWTKLWYKYWPFLDTGHSAITQRFSVYCLMCDSALMILRVEVCCYVPTTRLCRTKWVTSVWTVIIPYVAWPSTQVVGMRSQWQGTHMRSVPEYECLPHELVVQGVWQAFTYARAQCTVAGAH